MIEAHNEEWSAEKIALVKRLENSRNETLDEAAKLADGVYERLFNNGFYCAASGADNVASVIRAAKTEVK